jgi:hypothetical protein
LHNAYIAGSIGLIMQKLKRQIKINRILGASEEIQGKPKNKEKDPNSTAPLKILWT